MTDSNEKQGIIDDICKAFSHRTLPISYVRSPIYEGEVQDEYSIDRHIRLEIVGKSWDKVKRDDFIVALYYLSDEAFCYYLPAIMIESIEKEDDFDALSFYLEPPVRYSVESHLQLGRWLKTESDLLIPQLDRLRKAYEYCNDDISAFTPKVPIIDQRERLYKLLNSEERKSIAKYLTFMSSVGSGYDKADIDYWLKSTI